MIELKRERIKERNDSIEKLKVELVNKVQKQIETYDTARSKNIQITKSDDDSFNSDSFRASPKELK